MRRPRRRAVSSIVSQPDPRPHPQPGAGHACARRRGVGRLLRRRAGRVPADRPTRVIGRATTLLAGSASHAVDAAAVGPQRLRRGGGLAWAVTFLLLARPVSAGPRIPWRTARCAGRLNAVYDIRVLYCGWTIRRRDMARLFLLPAWLWASAWMLLALVFWARRLDDAITALEVRIGPPEVRLAAGVVSGASPWRPCDQAPPASPSWSRRRSGPVRGTGSDVIAFKGIPYAAPPTGDRRWRPPQPPAAWTMVRDASTFGPACTQPANFAPVGRASTAQPPPASSEDCLTLNVWTPARGDAARLRCGVVPRRRIHHRTAAALVTKAQPGAGWVVVVSTQLASALGISAPPQLSAESTQRVRNYGRDEVAALKCVQPTSPRSEGICRHIFGQSAGRRRSASLGRASPRVFHAPYWRS